MEAGKSKVTFINTVSLFGLALLACTTFMGAMLVTHGSIGLSAAIALGTSAVVYLVVTGAAYAKRADSEVKRWKRVEIVLAVLFWIVGVVPALFTAHFVSVISNGDQLRDIIKEDAESVRSLFDEYEKFERNVLAITHTGLQSAIGQPSDDQLREYCLKASIEDADDIENWMLTQRGLLLGSTGVDGFSYIDYKANVDSVTGVWESEMSSLNPLKVSRHSGELADMANEVVERLGMVSSQASLPDIKFDNGIYKVERANMTFKAEAPVPEFDSAVSGLSGSILGYIVAVVMLLLVYLDYMMARRSGKSEISDNGDINKGGYKL